MLLRRKSRYNFYYKLTVTNKDVVKSGASQNTSMETVWSEVPLRLAKFRRVSKVKLPNGDTFEAYFRQKHPVSTEEVQSWLEKHGLIVEQS